MKINCSHCKEETDLRRPKKSTIFNIQCYFCKSYFCWVWKGNIKNSKPIEVNVQG